MDELSDLLSVNIGIVHFLAFLSNQGVAWPLKRLDLGVNTNSHEIDLEGKPLRLILSLKTWPTAVFLSSKRVEPEDMAFTLLGFPANFVHCLIGEVVSGSWLVVSIDIDTDFGAGTHFDMPLVHKHSIALAGFAQLWDMGDNLTLKVLSE